MYLKVSCFTCVLSLIALNSANAQVWRIQSDNDILMSSDGNYSNGLHLSWQKNSQELPLVFNSLARLSFQDAPANHYSISLYQGMWTPVEILFDEPQPEDRPYAGLLTVNLTAATLNSKLAEKTALRLGVIGPLSGAESSQTWVHKVTGSSTPNGWDHQIQNQAIIQGHYEFDYLIKRFRLSNANEALEHEFSILNSNSLGNFRSETKLGLQWRLGHRLGDTFGQNSYITDQVFIRPSNSNYQWYTYMSLLGGLRLNDLSIEGSLPYESAISITHTNYVGQLGIFFRREQWGVELAGNLYSKEYQSDPKSNHSYASLNFFWYSQ